MSNTLLSQPMILDTDITTWRNATTVVAAGYTTGIRIQKLVLAVGTGGASTAGTVTIQSVSDSATLYPPLVVAGSTAASTILFVDNPTDTESVLAWRDFKVTGLTATGTRLFLWWGV